MATDIERLVVHIEGQTAKFEKALDRIERKTSAASKRVEKQAQAMEAALSTRAAGALSAINSLSGALGGGTLLAGLGLAAVIGQLRQVASEFAGIADTADRTGLGTDQIQELGYTAEMAGGTVEDMNSGLVKFSKNLSEAARGSGDLAKVLDANGVSLNNADGSLRSTTDMLGQYADLVKNAATPQDALNLATMAFGKSAGPALVVALKDGRDGLKKSADEAHRFGAVADADVIKKAAEIDDKFVQLARVIKVQFGSAMIEGIGAIQAYENALIGLGVAVGAVVSGATLGPLVASIAAAVPRIASTAAGMGALAAAARVAALAGAGLSGVLAALGGPAGVAIAALVATVGYLALRQDEAKVSADNHKTAMEQLDAAIDNVKKGAPNAVAELKKLGEVHVDNAKKALQAAEAEYAYLKALGDANDMSQPDVLAAAGAAGVQPEVFGNYLETRAAKIEAAVARIKAAQGRLTELQTTVETAPTEADKSGPKTKIPTTDTGGNDKKDSYDRELKQIRERTSLLEVEAQTVGKGTYEIDRAKTVQELLNAAKEAGRALTPDLIAQIDAEAEAHARATQKVEQAQEAYQRFETVRDGLAGAFSGMASAVRKSESAIDALSDSLNRLLDQVMDMISQQLFKQLFAGIPGLNFSGLGAAVSGSGGIGHAATGGPIRGPGSGTSDSIPTMLSNGEFVVRASQAKRYGALLEAINSGRLRLPAFATGGPIGGPVARAAGGSGGVKVVVNNTAAADGYEARAQSGGINGEQLVVSIVRKATARGDLDQAQRLRFNVRPPKIGRG